jgi:thiosulfate dehydrogenase
MSLNDNLKILAFGGLVLGSIALVQQIFTGEPQIEGSYDPYGKPAIYSPNKDNLLAAEKASLWQPPAWDKRPGGEQGELIAYGKELIVNTAQYLSRSHGSVMKLTNGLNCQNCHLQAGTKPFGNNYGAVASTYPKFRARSGSQEDIPKRVNDCVERSLDGGAGLPLDSRELKAMVAYIEWLGKDVPKGQVPKGSGLVELPYLDRAASPDKGKLVYERKCASCHGKEGEGIKNASGPGYQYPPLWGPESYNTGAGLYRLSRFAGYVKANMPFGASYDSPQLSDEEAWDLAAFVNSMPHPSKDISKDWPDISKKPLDHPFGPFADAFTEEQHKFGPFGPMKKK